MATLIFNAVILHFNDNFSVLFWLFMCLLCHEIQGQPVHVMTVTSTPYGAGYRDINALPPSTRQPSFACLLSQPDTSTQTLDGIRTGRFVLRSKSEFNLGLPAGSSTTNDNANVLRTTYLPYTGTSQGMFYCEASSRGQTTTVPVSIMMFYRLLRPASGQFTITVNAGDAVNFGLDVVSLAYDHTILDIMWEKLSTVSGHFETFPYQGAYFGIQGASVEHSGVYYAYFRDFRRSLTGSLFRLIVRACGQGKWGPPTCSNICENCYNGGLCDDKTGRCVCKPGFNGPNCLTACGENTFGWDCEHTCASSLGLSSCAGSVFCMPDPVGCSCMTGWTGVECNEGCSFGTFGAGCAETCNCQSGSCDRFTGRCEGPCSDGWYGESCQSTEQLPPTTTKKPTTLSPPQTTTEKPTTTSPPPTTTEKPTTTSPPPTTTEKSTTLPPTTTAPPPPTTMKPTTLLPTTTAPTTTTTTMPTTLPATTTSPPPTTTMKPTTLPPTTTSPPPTTTNKLTTLPATTTSPPTTTTTMPTTLPTSSTSPTTATREFITLLAHSVSPTIAAEKLTTVKQLVEGSTSLVEVNTQVTTKEPSLAVPDMPLNIKVIPKTATSVTITWNNAEDSSGAISHHRVDYRAMQSLPNSNDILIGPFTNTTTNVGRNSEGNYVYTLSNLDPGTTYEVFVSAENMVGIGPAVSVMFETNQPGSSDALIAGGSSGAVLLIICVIIVVVVIYKRCKAKGLPSKAEVGSRYGNPIFDLGLGDYEDVDLDDQEYEDITSNKLDIAWKDLKLTGKILGKGNFGDVQLGHVKIKNKWIVAAVKTLKHGTPKMERDQFKEEFDTMSRIGYHPNVVNILGSCENEESLYVVLEYVHNGNLRKYLRTCRKEQKESLKKGTPATDLTPDHLLNFALGVAKAMEHIADCGVIHRDLAARNVLVGRGYISKVADFGMSREDDIYVQTSSRRVPTRWLSIESMTKKMYSTKSDVWSFGILLWEIATFGGTPYPDMETKELAYQLTSGFRMERPENCEDDMYELMLQCWKEDPDARPSFKDIVGILTDMASNEKIYMSTHVYSNFKYAVICQERDDK